jgi:hypothetical protein
VSDILPRGKKRLRRYALISKRRRRPSRIGLRAVAKKKIKKRRRKRKRMINLLQTSLEKR